VGEMSKMSNAKSIDQRTLKGSDNLEDLEGDGEIILKLIFKK
jgi:hypothetical protein